MESRDSSPSSAATPTDVLRDDPALRSRELDIVDVLGEGGSAIVYRARDGRHARDVAVKVLRAQPAIDSARDRFSREVLVTAGLRHPHIMPLFDSGTLSDGRLFSVMPVAQGRPLSAMIAEGPMAVADTVRLAREVSQALQYLHERGYVHRDVKPENILIEAGHAVLTDFGVTASIDALSTTLDANPVPAAAETSAAHPRLTRVGNAVGTPHYMSPEAMFADGPIDARSDIYALGIVIHEMLAGAVPFGDTSPERLLTRRLREPMPSIRARRPDVPVELDAVIARATAVDPTARYASAVEMDDALAAVPIAERATVRARSPVDRSLASLGLVMLLVASIVGSSLWYRSRQAAALDPQVVVVADLANDTGDSTLKYFGALAGDFVSAAIVDSTSYDVVNATIALPSRLQRVVPSADSTLARETHALVESARAGLVVTGAFLRSGDGFDVVAEVTDTRSGRVIGVAGPLHTTLAQPDATLRELGRNVVAILRRRHAPP